MPPADSPETRIALVEQRQTEHERWRDRTDRTLESIAETLKGVLRIEAKHDAIAQDVRRVAADVEAQSVRLEKVEESVPLNDLLRKAVFTLAGTVMLAVVAAVLALVGLKA